MPLTKRNAKSSAWTAEFAVALKDNWGNVAKACLICNIARSTYYKTLKADEEFKRICREIQEALTDNLEANALKRATKGVLEPVFYQGQHCGDVRKWPESLTMFMLKARRKKYRVQDEEEKRDNGSNDVQVNITVKD